MVLKLNNLNVSRNTAGVKYDKNGDIITNPETGAFLPISILLLLSATAVISIIYLRKKNIFNKI